MKVLCYSRLASLPGLPVSCAVDHVVRFTRPSGSVFAYCKQSKTGAREGLGTRLSEPPFGPLLIIVHNYYYSC